MGCIGGVGWFLIITGLEVSARMTTELTYSLATFKFLFMNAHVFALWSSAFSLALLLRALQHKIKHPFLVPVFFMVVPLMFYAIVGIAGWDWDTLRSEGWVFPMPEGNAPGWQFYSYFGEPIALSVATDFLFSRCLASIQLTHESVFLAS